MRRRRVDFSFIVGWELEGMVAVVGGQLLGSGGWGELIEEEVVDAVEMTMVV
jgi:hypothetical protein